MPQTLALPSFEDATVVVPAPGDEPGNWSGAASAVRVDGVYYLAYRVRRPLREGRGVSVVVARSEDGEHFVTIAEVRRETFGAESFERPVLVRRPDGGWRLYLSCATPGSKHWWVEAVDADEPAALADGSRTVVLPGSDEVAVKDPVVLVDETGWRMWVCVHPLADAGHEDRMTTAFASSGGRALLGLARHRARPDPRHLGPARDAGERGAVRGAAGRAVRRPRERRGQLARGHRGGPLDRRPHAERRGRAADPLAARRRGAALRGRLSR